MTETERMLIAELQRRFIPHRTFHGFTPRRALHENLTFIGGLELACFSGLLFEIPQSAIRMSHSLLHRSVPQTLDRSLLLMKLFLQRIESSNWPTMDAKAGEETFNEFLWIDALMRNDSATNAYLAYCDSRQTKLANVIWPEVVRFNAIIFERHQLTEVTRDARIKRRSAEEMIEGFFKFVDFCIELDDFLDTFNDEPQALTRYLAFYSPYLDPTITQISKEIMIAMSRQSRPEMSVIRMNEPGKDLLSDESLSGISVKNFEQGIGVLERCEERVRLLHQ